MEDAALDEVLTERELEALRFGYQERVTDTHTLESLNYRVLASTFCRCGGGQSSGPGWLNCTTHAYTMSSLQPQPTLAVMAMAERRKRVRLPLEVFAAVRAEVGDGYPVGCRFLSDEIVAWGSGLEDACYFTAADVGMDFLSLSRGGKFDDAKQPKVGWATYPYTGKSGYECMPSYISDAGPWGRNVEPVALIRDSIRKAGHATPVVTAGGIYSFEQAEALLADDKADIVGIASRRWPI